MPASRIILFIAGLISIVCAPVWVPFLFVLALVVRWFAWEVLVLGICIDMLYLAPEFFFGVPFPATMFAFVLLWVFEPVRQRLMETVRA